MEPSTVRVDGSGRILLPSTVRKQLGLKQGSELVIRVENEAVLLKTRRQAIREAQEYFSKFRRKGELWSEELIKERRREARRERSS